jgi:hypothetical protein
MIRSIGSPNQTFVEPRSTCRLKGQTV